ncbi:hypothetical protein LY13_001521 [Prauserella aidingensis]|uniref:hypothetical protein n=1 Tax=Prauserella aidingensis TaxID=387890 RepID=UPI0020A5C1E0|nr:hypothetical protein [Prauserella aidingensis]MCP2252778.1 hypothetical protein [Prauserella aidingensis]
MTPHHPTMIDAVDMLAADPSAAVDSWWFAARLHSDETVFWMKIHTMAVQGGCHSTVAQLQEPDGHSSHKPTPENLDEVTLSPGARDARTSILAVHGDLDDISISGSTDTASVQLTATCPHTPSTPTEYLSDTP